MVLRDDFDAKAWGEAWKRDLSSEAEIYSDSNDGARKMSASLAQDQRLNQPRSHPSTTRRPNKFSLRRAMIHKNARPAQHLLPFHRCIRDASCQPRRALRLVVILGSDRRARASGDGG